MKKVNLGCGNYPLKDFINVDIYEDQRAELICNVVKLPFEDNSIDELYCGHCIEHLTMEEARKGLKEWLRILKPGCHIGIVVPEKNLTPKHMVVGTIIKDQPYRGHHSYWDLDLLMKESKKAGFEEAEIMNIDTYPHLVARPKWQVGIIAFKGGDKMKEKKTLGQLKEITKIPSFNPREESWCKNEKKVVYNPKKKKHCPYCKCLLEVTK